MTIRILGLDDDYHSQNYMTELLQNELVFLKSFSIGGLVKELAKPHMEEYEIKICRLVDLKEKEIIDFNLIDSMERNCSISYKEYQNAFDRLWEKSEAL